MSERGLRQTKPDNQMKMIANAAKVTKDGAETTRFKADTAHDRTPGRHQRASPVVTQEILGARHATRRKTLQKDGDSDGERLKLRKQQLDSSSFTPLDAAIGQSQRSIFCLSPEVDILNRQHANAG